MDRFKELVRYSLVDIEDPVNLVPVVIALFCVLWSGRPRGGLAWWALFNACLIHCWMDGIVGIFGRGPKWLVEQYAKLDIRYWKTQDPTVMMISGTELVIMGPLCILWYHSIVRGCWYRHAVAIITSTFHLMGTIIFFGTEVLYGCKHLPSNWPPAFDNFDDIFYFWFVFIFCNIVWVVLPISIIINSLCEMKQVYNPKKSSKKHN